MASLPPTSQGGTGGATVPNPLNPPPTVPQTFPFGAAPGTPSMPITYDIVIDKNFPRVAFVPTEPGGIYQEIVEVNGDLWFVTNATWDVNKLGFYQEIGTLVNCNPSQPAFAWCQRGLTGDAIRFYGAATGSTSIAITWVAVFDAAPNGTTISPLPITLPGQAALTVNTIFNGTIGTVLQAFAINVQDVASSGLSALEQFNVNGVPVWLVDKTGTLQIGTINPVVLNPPVYTQLIGGTGIATIGPPPQATIKLAHGDYVDLANNQTILGVKTIGGPTAANNQVGVPMFFGDGAGNIVGGPQDPFFLCSGCTVENFPSDPNNPSGNLIARAKSSTCVILAFKLLNLPTTQPPGLPTSTPMALTLFIDQGKTVGNTFTPTIAAYFDVPLGSLNLVQGNLTVGGTTTLTGQLTLQGALTVTGQTTLNGGLVLSPTSVNDLSDYFTGNTTLNYGGNNFAGLGISFNPGPTPPGPSVELDTGRLAYIGKDNTEGLFSSDKTVKITKQMWNPGPSTGDQNVDFSVADAVANALPVFYGGAKISSPLIVGGGGILAPGDFSGNNGWDGNEQATVNVTFPTGANFGNNNYFAVVSVGGGWFMVNVDNSGQTGGGFTFHVSVTNQPVGGGPPGNVTYRWIAIGQAGP